MRKLLQLLALLGLSAIPAFGQGVLVGPQTALRNTGTSVAAMVGATITVCAANAAALPCAPPLANTLFKDAALSQSLTNPFFADTNGNYIFAIAPGTYTVTVTQFGQGYSYQLTVACPLNGACTWTGNQTFNNITVTGTCTGCGSGSPSGATGTFQYNNSSAFAGAAGVTTANGNSIIIKGPEPIADIRAYGAKAYSSGQSANTTATCTANSATVTLAAAQFNNNDGITLRGCGATLALSTPAAPTVTPSLAIAGTGLGGGAANEATVASGTGASTYSYEVIYRDKVGGYTAPSTATTITNGLSSIGPSVCTISTISRSNSSITVDFTATCAGAVAKARFQVTGTTNSQYNGWYNVSTVNSTTEVVANNTFVDSRALGWQLNDLPSTSANGSAVFYLSNHLNLTYQSGMWEAYICAERPGDVTYTLIGTTKPSTSVNGGFRDLQFDDYGTPYNSSQTYPSYITNSLCNGGSAQNDPLTSTVSSGGGTTTITLADNASNNSSGLSAVYDIGPALIAAANAVNAFSGQPIGTILIPYPDGATGPNPTFLINSYTVIPGHPVIKEEGPLTLNETVQFGPGVVWDGELASSGVAQFAQSSQATVSVNTANPGLYAIGSNRLVNLSLSMSNTNGGIIEVVDNPGVGDIWDNVNFLVDGSNNNYLGMGLMPRLVDPAADTKFVFTNDLFYATAPASTALPDPIIYSPPGQNGSGVVQNSDAGFYFTNTNSSLSGIEWESCGGGPTFTFNGGLVRQAGYMPFITAGNCSGGSTLTAHLNGITLDTDAQGILNIEATGGTFNVEADVSQISAGSTGGGSNGSTPLITGQATSITDSQIVTGPAVASGLAPSLTGYGSCPLFVAATQMFCMFEPELIGSPNGLIFAPLASPTSVSGTAAAGGSIGTGTIKFAVTAVDLNGGETVASILSAGVTTGGSCPSSGNCEVNLTWTPPATSVGALTYNVYACGISPLSACPTITKISSNISGASLTVTTVGTGASQPRTSTAGQMELTPSIFWGPELMTNQTVLAEMSAPSTSAGYDTLYGDSTAHRAKLSNNNGSFLSVGQIICSQVAIALRTSLIGSAMTDSAATGACSGLTTSDSVTCTFSADPTSTTGFTASTSGVLAIYVYPTSNTINVKYQNNTNSGITPGAVTANCMAVR